VTFSTAPQSPIYHCHAPSTVAPHRSGTTLAKASSCPRYHSLRRNPHGPRKHHPSHRVRHCGRYERSSCPTLPVRQSRSLAPSPRDDSVIRLRNDPPLRGQWPPRVGSLALRRPCGRLVLGRRPLSCSQATVRAGATGGDQGPGTIKQRAHARRFPSPSFSVASNIFPFMSARKHSV